MRNHLHIVRFLMAPYPKGSKKLHVRIILLSLLFLLPFFHIQSQELPKEERLAWFKDAKLGIFIHWGIYAVDGIDESWSFFNGYISHEDYMKQLNGFTAANYQPKKWAEIIKKSGAKYAVITSKHHDGVALWDTKANDLSIAKKSPASRDVLSPFVKALRKEKLKVGIYYSLLDWSHPDYPNFTREQKRYEEDSIRWHRFVDFNFKQLEEISDYNPDLYWFDGDWEQTAEKWRAQEVRELLLRKTPHTIINSRLQGYGDYATPEQGVPVSQPKDEYWELCMTMNNSWGYQGNDQAYKSSNQIIRILVDCISMGGNLLLDIGPKADGNIPEEQLKILEDLGRWTNKHEKAIYGTSAGIPKKHFNGYTALSKDKNILYLYLDYQPKGKILLKGIKNKINRIWVVGNGTKLKHEVVGKQYWSSVPGLLYIDVPQKVQDKDVTVIAVLLEGPIDLYDEEVKAIESN